MDILYERTPCRRVATHEESEVEDTAGVVRQPPREWAMHVGVQVVNPQKRHMVKEVFGKGQPLRIPIPYPYCEEVRSQLEIEEHARREAEGNPPPAPEPADTAGLSEDDPFEVSSDSDWGADATNAIEEEEERVGREEGPPYQVAGRNRWSLKAKPERKEVDRKKIKAWHFRSLPCEDNPKEMAFVDMEFFEF